MSVARLISGGGLRGAAIQADLSAPEVVAAKLISNFGKVSDGVYRGTRVLTAEQARALYDMGVRRVINLQGGDSKGWLGKVLPHIAPGERPSAIAAEQQLLKAHGIETVNEQLPSVVGYSAAEDASVGRVVAMMNDAATGKGPVTYVHCEFGKDRTGLMVALLRVKHQGVSPREAMAEWERYGHDHVIHRVADGYFARKTAGMAPAASPARPWSASGARSSGRGSSEP